MIRFSINLKTSEQFIPLNTYATKGLLLTSPLAFVNKLTRCLVKTTETLKLGPGFFFRSKWFLGRAL